MIFSPFDFLRRDFLSRQQFFEISTANQFAEFALEQSEGLKAKAKISIL
jgi:hypothetical protein